MKPADDTSEPAYSTLKTTPKVAGEQLNPNFPFTYTYASDV